MGDGGHPVHAATFHYSNRQLRRIRAMKKQPERPDHKPYGFWLSVEGAGGDDHHWRWWCEGEQYPLGKLRYRIDLEPTADILHLASVAEIDAFDAEYGAPLIPTYALIDWRKVAAAYQGIIIAPYQWERRLSSTCRWYYTWDCASGCIWDARAIAGFELDLIPEIATPGDGA